MKPNLTDKNRIQHIIEAISNLEEFLKDISFEEFSNNKEKILAVERSIEIIGEASNHISEKIIFHPQISTPWRQIINTRNIIAH
jgi:uncharacterized protein with HEPN domain